MTTRRDSLAFWATACMLFDHIAVVLTPMLGYWAPLARIPGRFSMPAFALMTADASVSSSDRSTYASRLAFLALASELPYRMLFHEWVNAIWPLLVAVLTIDRLSTGKRLHAALIFSSFVAVCLYLHAPYQIPYAALPVLLAHRKHLAALLLAFVDATLLNSLFYSIPTAACLIAALYLHLPSAPSLSRRFRYLFYPVHLALLGFAARLFTA